MPDAVLQQVDSNRTAAGWSEWIEQKCALLLTPTPDTPPPCSVSLATLFRQDDHWPDSSLLFRPGRIRGVVEIDSGALEP